MAVELSEIYDEKVREFAVRGDSDRFMTDFITAARNTIRKLQIHGGQEVTLETVDGIATSITSLDEQYEYVVSAGITHHLMRLGQKPKDGRSPAEAKEEWLDAEGDYQMGYVSNKMQTATNDVVGLGAIGSNDEG